MLKNDYFTLRFVHESRDKHGYVTKEEDIGLNDCTEDIFKAYAYKKEYI